MKRSKWTIAILVIALLGLAILLVVDRKKISHQQSAISELEDEIETKDKKIEELNGNVGELERKIADLSEEERPASRNPLQGYPFSPNAVSRNMNLSTSEGLAVVVYKTSCDYFILENSGGYIVAEWMGGNDPEVGDRVSGDFKSFGTKDFYNQSQSSDSRLWIDDYWLSKETAMEKINDHCN